MMDPVELSEVFNAVKLQVFSAILLCSPLQLGDDKSDLRHLGVHGSRGPRLTLPEWKGISRWGPP